MENTFDHIESLFEKTKNYGKTSYELYKLKTISKTAEVVSTFVSRAAVVLVLFMFLVFASFGLSLWLGELLGKPYLGFLCVAAFYILLGVVLYFILHRFIKRKISNSIISEIFNK
ncbi:MAG: phage holin family protein [Brumimicrobium sp.]